MSNVGLFLSGAVLFLNSLMLLGKADGKSVGLFNIFVGTLQIMIPSYLIVVSRQDHWELYNYASIFLFGLTYMLDSPHGKGLMGAVLVGSVYGLQLLEWYIP